MGLTLHRVLHYAAAPMPDGQVIQGLPVEWWGGAEGFGLLKVLYPKPLDDIGSSLSCACPQGGQS